MQQERPIDLRISQQSGTLFGCGLVREDRRVALERRAGAEIAPRSEIEKPISITSSLHFLFFKQYKSLSVL